jgi:hypothetical protein
MEIGMSKSFRLATKLIRPGGGWHETEGFVVSFCPDNIFDQVVIANKSKYGNNDQEKISLSLEEAEWLVNFVKQARESYELWKQNKDKEYGD